MKQKIAKINAGFLEKLALSILGLLAGLILSVLLKGSHVDYFSLLLIFILVFLYVYYRHSYHVEKISSVLSDLYTNRKGDIQYYDSPHEFYKVSSNHILEAEHEILIYNDYFGHANPPMGFDTPEKYYENLESRLRKIDKLKFSCVISALRLSDATFSHRYEKHIETLFDISHKRDNDSNIIPFAFADKSKGPLYISFTIIDNNILRLPLKGIVDTLDDDVYRPSKIIGGFIIKDNQEVIEHFRQKFKNTEQIAIKYTSVKKITDSIKS